MSLNKNIYSNIKVLNTLRAFAAISVCLYHFICTTTGFITNNYILNIFSIGKNGVQLFFVISGFIIPWSMYNANYKISYLPKFLLKRLLRLEPPYIISILIALFIISARKVILKNNDVDFTLQQLSLHIGYLIPFFENFKWINQVYWTLAIEFQYYLLIAFLFIPLISNNKYYRFATIVILILCGLNTNSEFLLYWLPIFMLGILVFLYKINMIKVIEFCIITLITLIFLLFNHSVGEIIYSILGVISILFFSNKSFKIGDLFGEISYSIYLTHTIIGASIINILSHNSTNSIQKFFTIILGILITYIASKLLYYFVEKPSKLISSKIKYKK